MKRSAFKYRECTYCGSLYHTSLRCQKKPRRPMRQVAEKTLHKKQATDREWYQLNPPSESGTWRCYLQLNKDCEKILTRSTIQLEHVKSKARHPELKYSVSNLKPACANCNKLKGSLDLEDLALKYNHLKVYL